MTILQYLKEEGWQYYRSWPGLWPAFTTTGLALVIYKTILDCSTQREVVSTMCNNTATVTGILLALGVAATTFQLGTFSVAELQHFVGSKEALKHFDTIRTATKWTIYVLIGCFISGILLSVLSKMPQLARNIPSLLLASSVFVVVLAISHAGVTIRAAFDFADVKLSMAKALEQGPESNSEKQLKNRAGCKTS